MAIDIFLKLDGIDGESVDRTHRGAIELDSYSFGVSNPVAHTGATGAGAGKASFQEMHVTSHVSKASPKLFLDCASGIHIPKGIIFVRKAGASGDAAPVEFLTITMQNVVITSVQHGAPSRDDLPIETITMAFGTVKFEYKQQNPDGTSSAPFDFTWDLGRNRIA